MDVVGYLRYSGWVARPQTLLRGGCTERAIRNAVAAGDVLRLRHGVLALPGAPADLTAAVMANGLLSCVSAAAHHGLWRLHEPFPPHVLCRRGSAPGVVIHRGSLVPTEFPLPLAGVTDSLLHALRCRPAIESAVMVESALQQGRTSLGYLRERLPGNRNGSARAVLDLVDGTAGSAVEVVARILFRAEGFFTQTQVDLPGIGIVDFLLEGFLIVEIDGKTHLKPRQVVKDRRRNNASSLSGYVVLRYGYQDVVYYPERVVADVWQVLRGRVVR